VHLRNAYPERTSMKRAVFFHVPKCAGSTVYVHVKKQFKRKFSGRTIYDRLIGRKTSMLLHTKFHAEELGDKLASARQAKLVFGHFDWATYLDMAPHPDDYKFTFLREPKERLRSSYTFFCSPQGWGHLQLSGLPSDYTYTEYLSSKNQKNFWQVDNVMVRMFGGDFVSLEKTDAEWMELLSAAKRNLSELNYIGFQNNFDIDIVTLCNELGISSKKVKAVNRTVQPKENEECEHLQYLIEKRTKWDQYLYEFAKSLSA
jgi:hypothetical protein